MVTIWPRLSLPLSPYITSGLKLIYWKSCSYHWSVAVPLNYPYILSNCFTQSHWTTLTYSQFFYTSLFFSNFLPLPSENLWRKQYAFRYVVCLSINTYFARCHVPLMKLGTNIHHVRGHCWTGSQGQRSKVKAEQVLKVKGQDWTGPKGQWSKVKAEQVLKVRGQRSRLSRSSRSEVKGHCWTGPQGQRSKVKAEQVLKVKGQTQGQRSKDIAEQVLKVRGQTQGQRSKDIAEQVLKVIGQRSRLNAIGMAEAWRPVYLWHGLIIMIKEYVKRTVELKSTLHEMNTCMIVSYEKN